MAIDLLNLQPHKVSRDLSGYITYIYGAPKCGKTTLATQMDKPLLLAFEPGYHALPGVMAQDITSWAEMKQVYRQLKNPEVQQQFRSIIIDTIDIAADRCKKYICNQNAIEDLGDLGYGKGWTKFKDEFNEIFRGLTQLGYAVFFIGHDKPETVENPDGTSHQKNKHNEYCQHHTLMSFCKMTQITQFLRFLFCNGIHCFIYFFPNTYSFFKYVFLCHVSASFVRKL